MSKEQEATKGPGRGREWSPSFKRTVKGYVFPDLEFKQEVIEGTLPVVAKDLQTAVSGLGLTNDEIVLALNNAAKNKLVAEKTEGALGKDVVPENVLNKQIEAYRALPKFKDLKPAEQTAAIVAKLKKDEDWIEAVKLAVLDSQSEE